VLLPVATGLFYCFCGGFDLRMELMRWWYERYGFDSLWNVTTYGLWMYSWALYGSVVGPVTLMPVLVAMHVSPRRWAWWVWAAVVVWLLVNPAVWWTVNRGMPPQWAWYLGRRGGMDVLGVTVAQLGAFAVFASRVVGWRAAALLFSVGTVTGAASWFADWWTNNGHGPGLAYWGYVALGIVWHITTAVVLIGKALQGRRLAAEELWRCEGCGYDLRGLAAEGGSGLCPECGRESTR
jgi:hypothetical protein